MVNSTIHLCQICNLPVDVATCKTDERGQVVHEACYVARLALDNAPGNAPASSIA